jgi:hypothetical protein
VVPLRGAVAAFALCACSSSPTHTHTARLKDEVAEGPLATPRPHLAAAAGRGSHTRGPAAEGEGGGMTLMSLQLPEYASNRLVYAATQTLGA